MSYFRKSMCKSNNMQISQWQLHNVYTFKRTKTESQLARFQNVLIFKMVRGQEWIRTTEVEDSGFTVRPIWPLWNLPAKNQELKAVSLKLF